MFKNTILDVFLCLPLAAVIFSQGSSCNDSKTKANSSHTTNQTQNSGPPEKVQREMKGQWGGLGIAIEVGDSGATIEFDCAHGMITEKIVPDSSGKFVANGFHVRERPGPVREGDDTKGQPAIYSGSVDGQRMTLTVALAETKERIGAFTLSHGRVGRIRKCG